MAGSFAKLIQDFGGREQRGRGQALISGLTLATCLLSACLAFCETAERIPLVYPTEYIDSSQNAPAGEIAYVLRAKIPAVKIKNVPLDFVIQRTGKSLALRRRTVYHITSTQAYPYATEFSPSGQWVLVTTTYPTASADAYQLQFWDMAAARMQVGPTLAGYPETRWSPDSRSMAYFQGGDVFGEESRGVVPVQLLVYNAATGESQQIAHSPEAKSFCWTHQHSLLYTFKGR